MTSLLIASIKVSLLALGIIFLVLGILIGVIKLMTYFIPYEEAHPAPQPVTAPPTAAPSSGTAPTPALPVPAPAAEEEEHLAAIQAVITHHFRGSGNTQILNIQSK